MWPWSGTKIGMLVLCVVVGGQRGYGADNVQKYNLWNPKTHVGQRLVRLLQEIHVQPLCVFLFSEIKHAGMATSFAPAALYRPKAMATSHEKQCGKRALVNKSSCWVRGGGSRFRFFRLSPQPTYNCTSSRHCWVAEHRLKRKKCAKLG